MCVYGKRRELSSFFVHLANLRYYKQRKYALFRVPLSPLMRGNYKKRDKFGNISLISPSTQGAKFKFLWRV